MSEDVITEIAEFPQDEEILIYARELCLVCAEPFHFAWTDRHGEAVCATCGVPYKLYFYEFTDERQEEYTRIQNSLPLFTLRHDMLAPCRAYWQEKQRNMGLGTFVMNKFNPNLHGRMAFDNWFDGSAWAHKIKKTPAE